VFCAELFAEELLDIDPVGKVRQSNKERNPGPQVAETLEDEALLVDVALVAPALVDTAFVDPGTVELVVFN
jgi:hypothetical protein